MSTQAAWVRRKWGSCKAHAGELTLVRGFLGFEPALANINASVRAFSRLPSLMVLGEGQQFVVAVFFNLVAKTKSEVGE